MNKVAFVPVSRDEAVALTSGVEPTGPRLAFAPTPELVAELDYEPDQAEEAEYAALVMASLNALIRFGERLVVVGEFPEHLLGETQTEVDNGGVEIASVPASALISWFSDEADVDAAVAGEISGLSIDEAWERHDVQAFIAEHDLLWHGMTELRELTEQ